MGIRVNSVHPGLTATPMVVQEDTKSALVFYLIKNRIYLWYGLPKLGAPWKTIQKEMVYVESSVEAMEYICHVRLGS